jgi:translation initiation factor IF-2
MQRVKIKEIADELGLKPKDVLIKTKELEIEAKAHSSTVTQEDAEMILQFISTGVNPKKSNNVSKKESKEVEIKVNKEENIESKVDVKSDDSSPKVDNNEEVKKTETDDKSKSEEEKHSDTVLKRKGVIRKRIRIIRKSDKVEENKVKKENTSYFSSSNQSDKTPTVKKVKKNHKKLPAVSSEQGVKMNIERELSFDIEIDDDIDKHQVVLFDINETVSELARETEVQKQTKNIKTKKTNNPHIQQKQPIRRSSRRSKRPKVEQNSEKVDLIEISDDVRVYEFAEKINQPVSKVIGELFKLGTMMTKNDFLDADSIEILAECFEVEVKTLNASDALDYSSDYEEDETNSHKRAPIVTIMGHVDHGKTSLLDKIRDSKVASGEAGGITQHITSYMVEKDGNEITFIDTPGHAAFTAMRERGSQITDLIIIVVAGDDGVKEQTKEVISHAKASGNPIIVAVNKSDKEAFNMDKVKSQMAELEIMPADWGGDVDFVAVSAMTGDGIEDLLETIILQSEVMELTANPKQDAKGIVIEGSVEKGKGSTATVVVQNGTLRVGDTVVIDTTFGKVRSIEDDMGNNVKSLKPSQPGKVSGLDSVPASGSVLLSMDEKEARDIASKRAAYAREKELSKSTKVSIEELSGLVAEGKLKILPIILKADVQGSLEALKTSLEKMKNDEVKVNIIHSGVGGISESDIVLASASTNCFILGFNVRPTGSIKKKAQDNGLEIKTYSVIYDLLDDVEALLGGLMSPIISEEQTGQAEVRDTFVIPKVGMIAGCIVNDGKVIRGGLARVIRDGVVIHDNCRLSSLKRFKDDVKEVTKGYECGIMIENYNSVKVGDVIETFIQKETQATL